ncbi:MAG TPA: hypothetical protein VMV86_04055 [Methanosarcinales archaeon]|nr:hypothetical protein [Methanosarcinales archaeon]
MGTKSSDTAYDIKEASNENLTAKARGNYAKNAERNMKTGAHPIHKHMSS